MCSSRKIKDLLLLMVCQLGQQHITNGRQVDSHNFPFAIKVTNRKNGINQVVPYALTVAGFKSSRMFFAVFPSQSGLCSLAHIELSASRLSSLLQHTGLFGTVLQLTWVKQVLSTLQQPSGRSPIWGTSYPGQSFQAFGPLLGMGMKCNCTAENKLESGLDCATSENSYKQSLMCRQVCVDSSCAVF